MIVDIILAFKGKCLNRSFAHLFKTNILPFIVKNKSNLIKF